MSFFPNEPRQVFSPPKNCPQLGPGCYQPQKNNKNQRNHGYAPFGSLQKKKITNQQANNLGPGCYEVSGQICKPSITKYENANSIIIKINEQGWSQFKSKTNRFLQIDNQPEITPGPGQYERQRRRPKSQPKDFKRTSMGQKIKEINLRNYVERRKPTLFTDPTKEKDTIEEISLKSRPKGLSWSLNKQQRFDPLIKEPFQEEHKLQLIDKVRDQKKKQRSKSQSAVFASKSLKSHFQSEIYNTSNPFKVQLRKMINYKDERPGPGSYNYNEIQERKRLKFARHQFFGSTVERFKTEGGLQNIGPGYYTPKTNSLNKSPTKLNNQQEPELNRHSYIPMNSTNLGPGAYNLDKQKKHKIGCKWVFGSKQSRFPEETAIEQNQEQVDQYELQRKIRRQKEFEYRKQFLNSGNQANFASSSKRFGDAKVQTESIPVGHYDITQTDIAKKLQSSLHNQKEAIKINRNRVSAPFMSTVNRFKTQNQEQEKNPHHDCWCLVKSVEKQVYEHQSFVFTSKQKRTVVFENKSQACSPAVGTYNQERNLVKGSFNSRFLKATQTKTKKLNLWKAQKNRYVQRKPASLSLRQKQISMIKIN